MFKTTLGNTKARALITISLVVIAAISALAVYETRDSLIPTFSYSEENLFVSNGTLVDGAYQKSILGLRLIMENSSMEL